MTITRIFMKQEETTFTQAIQAATAPINQSFDSATRFQAAETI
jgi:hypothetical protein